MASLKRGRPLLLGLVLDEKVKHFLLQLWKKSGVVNTVVAVATAKALIAGSRDHFKFIDLESTPWVKRVYLSEWDFAKPFKTRNSRIS